MWISIDEIMDIGLDAHALETLAKGVSRPLPLIMCDDHRAHHESPLLESIAQSQHILVVGNAQIGARLVGLYVFGTDDDYYFDAFR